MRTYSKIASLVKEKLLKIQSTVTATMKRKVMNKRKVEGYKNVNKLQVAAKQICASHGTARQNEHSTQWVDGAPEHSVVINYITSNYSI